ncbi:MAG: TonB-dependent receptor [Flavobacteriaceae bacterium]|nr:TonB-dependent receptor [Flavobacteriaceae bacterium]
MSLNKNKVLALIVIMFIQISYSQKIDSTKVEHIEEVMVSATRTKRKLSSLPVPAKIIGGQEIKQTNSIKLNDILSEQTGIIMVPEYGSQGVQIQGLDAEFILILIDGMPLIGRTTGNLDLSRIMVGNIKQIEVVKGASSSLYGSDALGGVINIITDKPKKGTNANITARYGSYNVMDFSATFSTKQGNLSASTFIDYYKNDGFSHDGSDVNMLIDPYSNITTHSKIIYDINENLQLYSSLRSFNQKLDYKYIILDEDISYNILGNDNISELSGTIRLTHKGGRLTNFLELYATKYDNIYNDKYIKDNSLYSEGHYKEKLLKPEYRSVYRLDNNTTISAGVGFTYQTLDKSSFYITPEVTSQYAYVQYDLVLTDILNIITGVRYDDHSDYKSQFNPKLAIKLDILPKVTSVKMSMGRGYKSPAFRQLYYDFTNSSVGYSVIGYNVAVAKLNEFAEQGIIDINNLKIPLETYDTPLDAQSSYNYNIGFNYRKNHKFNVDVNLFYNSMTNLIDTKIAAIKISNGQSVYTYYNVDKAYSKGFEFDSYFNFNKELKLKVGYQYLIYKSKDDIDKVNEGNLFASVNGTVIRLKESDYIGLFNKSKHMANTSIVYTNEGFDISLRAIYRGSYGAFDTNGNEVFDKYDDKVSGYTLFNTSVNKNITDNLKLGLSINNILDFVNKKEISNITGRIINLNINYTF